MADKAKTRTVGRKSTFNRKDAAEIVSRLSKGEPLTHICADDWLPCDDTVRNWAEANPDFARDIARAREAGFDQIALDALRIADGKSTPEEREQAALDYAETGTVKNADPQRDRLRVETRLKLLAKWDPKRYGDKVAHVGGDDTDAPIKSELNLRFV